MQKRLTVIIPGYRNSYDLWKACLESVRSACGPDDEIICVDDCSPDGFRLKEFEGMEEFWSDPRVTVITRETNGGLSVARNTALKIAQGRYVAFVDSDDQVNLCVYDQGIARLEESGADIALFGVRVVWEAIKLTRVSKPSPLNWGVPSPQVIKELSDACLLNYAWNKIYRTSFLRGENISHQSIEFLPGGMPCEDIIFNLDCICAGSKWCGVDVEGYVYFRREGTLLANYKRSNMVGLHAGSEAWKRYKESVAGAYDFLGNRGEFSPGDFINMEWQNIWKPHSPIGLSGRWDFLRENRNQFTSPLKAYLRQLIFIFLRRHFYFKFLQRYHIRKMYPDVMKWGD